MSPIAPLRASAASGDCRMNPALSSESLLGAVSQAKTIISERVERLSAGRASSAVALATSGPGRCAAICLRGGRQPQ